MVGLTLYTGTTTGWIYIFTGADCFLICYRTGDDDHRERSPHRYDPVVELSDLVSVPCTDPLVYASPYMVREISAHPSRPRRDRSPTGLVDRGVLRSRTEQNLGGDCGFNRGIFRNVLCINNDNNATATSASANLCECTDVGWDPISTCGPGTRRNFCRRRAKAEAGRSSRRRVGPLRARTRTVHHRDVRLFGQSRFIRPLADRLRARDQTPPTGV